MKYVQIGLLICCVGVFMSGCSVKEKEESKTQQSITELSTTEEKTEDMSKQIIGKNFHGKMGKHTLGFTFLEGNKYREVSEYSVVGEKSITYTEGEYLIHNGEIILRPDTNKTYTVLPNQQYYYLRFEENSTKENFERLYLENDGSILLTYQLKKEEVENKSASDDSYTKLLDKDAKVESFEEVKSKMVQTKDTSSLFKTADMFGDWVLAHMGTSKGYSYRILSDDTVDDGYRYIVNIYTKGYESSPGTTIAIDNEGNMYNDTPKDGNSRNLSRDVDWDKILDTDIESGEIVITEDNTGKEKLQEMVGKWGVVPGDSWFTILSDSEFEFFRGPGEPLEIKQVKEVSLEGNKLIVTLEDRTMYMDLIDDKSLKIDGTTYQKIK